MNIETRYSENSPDANKEYSLEAGIEELVNIIKKTLLEKSKPIVVEIAGGSASGKTSIVAEKLKEKFKADVAVLSMDNYGKGKRFIDEAKRNNKELTFDDPEFRDLELLKLHLTNLRNGKEVQEPTYDFKISEPRGTHSVTPAPIIIIEGLYALHDFLASEGDVRVFVDIGTHGRMIRRLLRDIQRTGKKPTETLRYFIDVVEPKHEEHVIKTRRNANLIINNEYHPKLEASSANVKEIELKFRASITHHELLRLGAERLRAFSETQIYYNPRDKSLKETDEILSIRDEGSQHVLSYKGPNDPASHTRPVFEFPIDAETEKRFIKFYSADTKIMHRKQVVYRLSGVEFSINSVFKIEKGEASRVGQFLELHSNGNPDSHEIEQVAKILGFELEQDIPESYVEM